MFLRDLGRFLLRPFQKDRGLRAEGAPGFPGKLRAAVHRALHPGAKWSAGIIVVGGLLLALVFGWELTETALGYAAYLLSAYALVLLVLSLVPLARLLREKALRLPPVRMYLQQEVLRARIALCGGVCVNLVYAAYRGALGIAYGSVWFGATAAYYLVLSGIRLYVAWGGFRGLTPRQEARRYTATGALMLLLSLAMAGMIVQMVLQNEGYSYPGTVIYASAAYTFYSLVLAAVNLGRRHRLGLLLSAAKIVNFAAALMSLLALQTAMLAQFGGPGEEAFRRAQNAMLGGFVTLATVGMAAAMIVRGRRQLRRSGRS